MQTLLFVWRLFKKFPQFSVRLLLVWYNPQILHRLPPPLQLSDLYYSRCLPSEWEFFFCWVMSMPAWLLVCTYGEQSSVVCEMSALKGLKITPLMHLISVRCYTLPKSIVCTIMMNMLFSLIFAIHFLGSIYCMEESVSQKEDKRGREWERGRCLKIEAGIARTVFFLFSSIICTGVSSFTCCTIRYHMSTLAVAPFQLNSSTDGPFGPKSPLLCETAIPQLMQHLSLLYPYPKPRKPQHSFFVFWSVSSLHLQNCIC